MKKTFLWFFIFFLLSFLVVAQGTYIDFDFSDLESELGNDPGFDGGGIYIPEGATANAPVMFLFHGHRSTTFNTAANSPRVYLKDGAKTRFDTFLDKHISGGGKPVVLVELIDADQSNPYTYSRITREQYSNMILSFVTDKLSERGITPSYYNFFTFSGSGCDVSKVMENMFSVDVNYDKIIVAESTCNDDYLKPQISSNTNKFNELLFVWRGINNGNDVSFNEYINSVGANKLASIQIDGKKYGHGGTADEAFKAGLKKFFGAGGIVPGTPQVVGQVLNNQKILHIGDSQTAGFYGRELDRLLKKKVGKKNVFSYGCSGAAIGQYIGGGRNCVAKKFDGTIIGSKKTSANGDYVLGGDFRLEGLNTLVNKHRPNIVIISLGGNNYAQINNNPRVIKDAVIALSNEVPDNIPCYWVGPVAFVNNSGKDQRPKLDDFYKILDDVLKGKCQLIDSRPYTNDRRGNVHLSADKAKPWVQAVFNIVSSGVRPTTSTGTATPSQPSITTFSQTKREEEIDSVWKIVSEIIKRRVGEIWVKSIGWVKEGGSASGAITPQPTTPGRVVSVTEQEINALKDSSAEDIKNFIREKLGEQYIEDVEYLTKILFKERSCSDYWAKERGGIAQVAINRVNSQSFPNTIKDVVASNTWNAGFAEKIPVITGIEDINKRGCTISALKFLSCVGVESEGGSEIGGRTLFAHLCALSPNHRARNRPNPLTIQGDPGRSCPATFSGNDVSSKDCSLRLYR